jgi:predicted acyl esterase
VLPQVPFEPRTHAANATNKRHAGWTFRSGHRIMVQVQSSWFPLVDRNPQTFVAISRAKESDYRKAMHRIYHRPELPSQVTVLVVP